MPRAVTSMTDVKVGDKVYLFTTEFTGTVEQVNAIDYTVKVRDPNRINTHYIALNRLLRPARYTVGASYADPYGTVFTFERDDVVDAWETPNGTLQDYNFPMRPLRQVTYGPELND